MRIQRHGAAPVDREKVGGAAPGTPGAAAGSEAVRPVTRKGSDSVVVSPAASELSAHAARGKAAHAEHVARVRAAVQDGSYRPDLDQLAHRFVDEELTGPRRQAGPDVEDA